jgi:hypothetical protein
MINLSEPIIQLLSSVWYAVHSLQMFSCCGPACSDRRDACCEQCVVAALLLGDIASVSSNGAAGLHDLPTAQRQAGNAVDGLHDCPLHKQAGNAGDGLHDVPHQPMHSTTYPITRYTFCVNSTGLLNDEAAAYILKQPIYLNNPHAHPDSWIVQRSACRSRPGAARTESRPTAVVLLLDGFGEL